MRRSTAKKQFDPDQNYQLPHPVLVSDPPTLLERTRANITHIEHLCAQVVIKSCLLRLDVAELVARGECPSDLRESCDKVLAKGGIYGHEEEERRGVGGLRDDDADAIHRHSHKQDNILDSIGMGMSEGGEVEEERLAKILGGFNFHSPILTVQRYGPRVISEALLRLYRRPSGEVGNPGAYLRGILKSYPQSNDPQPVQFRFRNGKYGHVVQT